jgi:hypothetical protein
MNHETVALLRSDYPTGHPFQTVTLTLAATTETSVKLSNGNVAIVAVPSQTAIIGSSTPMSPNANPANLADVYGSPSDRRYLAGRPYFSSTAFDGGRPFRVRWVGRGSAVANGGNTLTLRIYQGTTGAVVGTAGNVIAATSAIGTTGTANLTFMIEATVNWDSTQQTLNGWFIYAVYYNTTATFATTAALTSNTSVATYAGLSFLQSVQWGNAAGGRRAPPCSAGASWRTRYKGRGIRFGNWCPSGTWNSEGSCSIPRTPAQGSPAPRP